MCFTVDHKVLFGELTDQTVEDGFFFYTTFYNAPPVIRVRHPFHGALSMGKRSLSEPELLTWYLVLGAFPQRSRYRGARSNCEAAQVG